MLSTMNFTFWLVCVHCQSGIQSSMASIRSNFNALDMAYVLVAKKIETKREWCLKRITFIRTIKRRILTSFITFATGLLDSLFVIDCTRRNTLRHRTDFPPAMMEVSTILVKRQPPRRHKDCVSPSNAIISTELHTYSVLRHENRLKVDNTIGNVPAV